MNLDPTTPVPPRWLHVLAVLTVLCTLPLLFLGAGVTSHGVGMVDPQGFRSPLVIVQGLLANNGLAFMLEYGHRTCGFLVGIFGILLAMGCFFFDPRPRMGWLAFLALAMICAQGALGIFRVDYDALHGRTFAMMHGWFAQLVFAVLVSVALFLSRRWVEGNDESTASAALRKWSIITALIVFGELLLGGVVRHTESLLGPRGHLLGAFVVAGAVVWLLKLIRESEARESLRLQRILLMAFLTVQLLLGVESWLAKFFVPRADFPQLQPFPLHAEWIRTLHYLIGTLIFSTTLVLALIANRKSAAASDAATVSPRELEGASP